MSDWKNIVVGPRTSLREAMMRIDDSSLQVALVVEENGRLAGVLTDGDIRRAILRGVNLEVPASEVMNPHATTVSSHTPREDMLALMRRNSFHHLPLTDGAGRLVGLATLDELIGAMERPNWVVLMAGGMGTRLRPLTEECPKPLLPVGGKPILENIVESFAEQGFKRFFISVNYKADMIRDYFGKGDKWGVEFNYLHETERLGTAGALSLLPSTPPAPLVVMNGDLLTRTNFDSLLDFHNEHRASATMAVRDYEFQVPYGVVRLDGTKIDIIQEKPVQRFFVNAGIYVLSPHALNHLPQQSFFDMPSLFERLIATGEPTAAYPLREYWLDIGRLEEFERAQREWRGRIDD